MGMILDTNDDVLGLEERRESFYVFDQQRADGKSEHIFAYEDGYIELSKELLLKLVQYFDKVENREKLVKNSTPKV